MSFRIFLTVAVFSMAQGLQNNKDLKIQLHVTPQVIKVLNHRDDFGPLILLRGIENYLEKPNSKITECYGHHSVTHKKIIKNYADGAKKLAKDSEKRFTGKFEDLGKRLSKYLKAMAKLLESYPEKMLELVKAKHYGEAERLLNEAWFKIEFTEAQLLGAVKRFKKRNPDLAVKAVKTETRYDEFRAKAKGKSEELLDDFESCMGNVGNDVNDTSESNDANDAKKIIEK